MGLSILIVDDAPGIRQLLRDVLEDGGYSVIAAGNGQEALDIVDRQEIGLIVTDVRMPELDGPGLCRALTERGLAIPVVVMSSSNAEDVAVAVGAVGYLDKPFTVYQARATVEAALRGVDVKIPTVRLVAQERALRVFVATSQHFLSQMLKLTLDHGVYVTRAVDDFAAATAIIRDWHPQLAIIDLDTGGEKLLRHIGQNHVDGAMRIPIVAVTRHRGIKARLDAFNQGVDDVLTVPISPEDLLVRVLAITRRTFGETFPLRPVIKLGDLEVDILNHQVRIGTIKANLTETEQSLLYLLAANSGEVLTADEIQATIWGVEYPVESSLVKRHIRSLQVKLQNGRSGTPYIVTVPGQGYRFDPVVLDLAAASATS
jgi:DNA-binding response OmpR family regulator